MKNFALLYDKISHTKSTKEKKEHIIAYFEKATPEDAAWALFFLSGHRLKRLIGPSKLMQWAIEKSGLPAWLTVESYAATGDLADTIALLLTEKEMVPLTKDLSLSQWLNERILPLMNQDALLQREKIFQYWQELDSLGLFILNKMLTGSFRMGVSHLLTLQALSQVLNVSRETLSHKLMGRWDPTPEFFYSLSQANQAHIELNPYPFYLASPLEKTLESLGKVEEWFAEWKWDGIRAQCILRQGQVAIWSRGNELVTHQFPELVDAIKKLECDAVLDGEILAYTQGPLVFGELQKRLGRKTVSKSMMQKVPIVFMIYDVLEINGKDMRTHSLLERRRLFENWDIDPRIKISPFILFTSWEQLQEIRKEAPANHTEGLILKRKSASYGVGRKRGNWWKYKVEPRTLDAILIYAQAGSGWRANLYTDYTFGVWDKNQLVPIAKAYSGLSMEEIKKLDGWIRKNTLEKFGPVRKVKPEKVFEIAFEGIQASGRHKAGVALRFPRILRCREDKPPNECDTLESIKNNFLT